MKILFTSLLVFLGVQFAFAETWKFTEVETARGKEGVIIITVTAKNVSGVIQAVPASPHEGEEGFAQPNSFLWPQGLSMTDAIRAQPSHYYAHNSRSCHTHTNLVVPAGDEVSFRMFDRAETIGKRLLIVFDSDSLGSRRSIVGGLNVPEPNRREQDAAPNPLPAE